MERIRERWREGGEGEKKGKGERWREGGRRRREEGRGGGREERERRRERWREGGEGEKKGKVERGEGGERGEREREREREKEMERQRDKNIPDMYVDAINFLLLVQVRERLRTAQERNIVLEDELMLANQEVRDSTHKPHDMHDMKMIPCH